jgi:hypothetical protein
MVKFDIGTMITSNNLETMLRLLPYESLSGKKNIMQKITEDTDTY